MVGYRGDNKWTVYVHIVPKEISGYEWDKYYVGITSRKPEVRWGKNGSRYKTQIFYRAIERYTWDKIHHETIASNLTKDEACDLEKVLIKELNSNDPIYGYNFSSGGEGATGLFGEKNPNFGNHWTNEQKKKMSDYKKEHPSVESKEGKQKKSEFMKNKWEDENYRNQNSGKNAPCYGRIGVLHPLYGKTGSDSACSKKVICLDTNKIYISATDACKSAGLNHSKLCMCCRGERKSCGKDENGNPLHWMYYNDYLKENNLTDEEARKSLFFIEEKRKEDLI